MICGRPFSVSLKSSFVRSRTISFFLVRTVARTLTTLTPVVKVASSCWAPASESAHAPAQTKDVAEARNWRLEWCVRLEASEDRMMNQCNDGPPTLVVTVAIDWNPIEDHYI